MMLPEAATTATAEMLRVSIRIMASRAGVSGRTCAAARVLSPALSTVCAWLQREACQALPLLVLSSFYGHCCGIHCLKSRKASSRPSVGFKVGKNLPGAQAAPGMWCGGTRPPSATLATKALCANIAPTLPSPPSRPTHRDDCALDKAQRLHSGVRDGPHLLQVLVQEPAGGGQARRS